MALFEARDLTIRFGGHNAVNAVDLDVESGCVTGLIGPNGAGKTTIFNAITGLRELSSGTLTLDGRDITRATPRQRARFGIARTFQQLEVFGSLSVRGNVLVAAEIRRRFEGVCIVAVLPSDPVEGDTGSFVRQSVDRVANSFEEAVQHAALRYPEESVGKLARVAPHAAR